MVSSVDASFQQGEIPLNRVGRNMPTIVITGIFLPFMIHHVVFGKILMHEVVDGCLIRLDSASNFDVLFHNRLNVRKRNALDWERANLAAFTIHQATTGRFLL